MKTSPTLSGPHFNQARHCEPILRSLPDWFGIEDAIVHYVEVIDSLPTFCAVAAGETIGFLSLKTHSPGSAEIYVMGIRSELHRRGIGRQLCARAELWLHDQGVRFLQVKTLSSAHPDPNYARTRDFYQAIGFSVLEELPDLWGEHNPCLLMIKHLG
jgi:ribosomal protein S18 acetylase RimI-like enzyme